MAAPLLSLPEDPKEAVERYCALRRGVRETFQTFLRNLNSQALRWLEQQFEKHGGDLDSSEFLRVFTRVCPQPRLDQALGTQERQFITKLAALYLFEGIDVDQSGEASWIEFVEFVCAVAEELRLQGQELSGQTFDFNPSQEVAVPYRPTVTKCHFDRLFFWPEHPMESIIIFEEGQTGFHLHYPNTLVRRRRIDGHRHELLAAAFMPEPFVWIVTSANDKTLCFWDSTFKLVKKWNLDFVVGVLCWCDKIKALYAADHASERVLAWRIEDTLAVRDASMGTPKPDKSLEFKSCHTKPVQSIIWISQFQSLATGSLDSTVQLFDLVQLKRTHVLSGHKKGITCLVYFPKTQMLLSSGFDNFIAIWDPSSGTLSHTLTGHECSIAGFCALPETDNEFLSVDFEGVVKLWDVRKLACLQSFHATDRQAEKAGELEPLEPRAICPLSRDRVLISGRRMVVFYRDASEPRVTADWPINAMAFNRRRIEIVTPVKNDLYVWCAIDGKLLTVHDNVTEGNITVIHISLGERRIFAGADDGSITSVNYACGALLKTFTPHAYEVSQIESVPGKLLTLSTDERLINVHDDNDPKRAVVLKRIDLSYAGTISQFTHDGREMIAGASEDGDVFWYNMDFAKQVSSSETSEVRHDQTSASCCQYFTDAPLIVTADMEGCAIFWSVPPLRTYAFFSKVRLALGSKSSAGSHAGHSAGAGAYGVTALAISWPVEDHLFVGTDRGSLVCICIKPVVDNANRQREEILLRKASGEAAAVISGRIFDSMPKPCDSPDYVFALPSTWATEGAHRGGIDSIVLCQRRPPVILTLGTDACVRMWSHDSGEALGTLEQGVPEGLFYQRESEWRFPIDAAEQVRLDTKILDSAVKKDKPVPPKTPEPPQPSAEERKWCGLGRRASAPNLHASGHSSRRATATGPLAPACNSFSPKKVPSRLHEHLRSAEHADWLAGSMGSHFGGSGVLPKLQSGMRRPGASQNKAVLEAARNLSQALGVLGRSGVDHA